MQKYVFIYFTAGEIINSLKYLLGEPIKIQKYNYVYLNNIII